METTIRRSWRKHTNADRIWADIDNIGGTVSNTRRRHLPYHPKLDTQFSLVLAYYVLALQKTYFTTNMPTAPGLST